MHIFLRKCHNWRNEGISFKAVEFVIVMLAARSVELHRHPRSLASAFVVCFRQRARDLTCWLAAHGLMDPLQQDVSKGPFTSNMAQLLYIFEHQ